MTKSIPSPMSSAAVPLVAADRPPKSAADSPKVSNRPKASGTKA